MMTSGRGPVIRQWGRKCFVCVLNSADADTHGEGEDSVSTPLSFPENWDGDDPLDQNGLPEVIDLTGYSSDGVST